MLRPPLCDGKVRLPGNVVRRASSAIIAMRDERGSALLEFAVALPLLVVFVVGIFDFSGAFNQKQKIEQAAQEGAIIAGAQPMSDIGSASPSMQAVQAAIINSLIASGVVSSSCAPVAGTLSGLTWTYSISGCPGTLVITVNRGWSANSTPASVGTRVTVQYPYIWKFNSVIQLLIPGASYAATTQLTEVATVHNQT